MSTTGIKKAMKNRRPGVRFTVEQREYTRTGGDPYFLAYDGNHVMMTDGDEHELSALCNLLNSMQDEIDLLRK